MVIQVSMTPRKSDKQYLAMSYDDWQQHVYATDDQRFNTICTVCSRVESVSKPLRVDTIWWVCSDCLGEEE